MAVHSKNGTTWLTKLKRIGERSAADNGLAFNNLGHLISADMLKEQYRQLNGNKAVGIDGVSKHAYGETLDENIDSLIKHIRSQSQHGLRKFQRKTEVQDRSPFHVSRIKLYNLLLAASSVKYEPLFLPCSFGFRLAKAATMH